LNTNRDTWGAAIGKERGGYKFEGEENEKEQGKKKELGKN